MAKFDHDHNRSWSGLNTSKPLVGLGLALIGLGLVGLELVGLGIRVSGIGVSKVRVSRFSSAGAEPICPTGEKIFI